MARYLVAVSAMVSMSTTMDVVADNEEQAKAIAKEKARPIDMRVDWDLVEVLEPEVVEELED